MEKQTFTVPTISCNHCVMTIKKEISALKGVSSVEGDADQKTVTVEWEAPTTLEKIKDSLTGIHFPAA